MNKHFPESQEIWLINKYIKRFRTSLVEDEMQIFKTTMQYWIDKN